MAEEDLVRTLTRARPVHYGEEFIEEGEGLENDVEVQEEAEEAADNDNLDLIDTLTSEHHITDPKGSAPPSTIIRMSPRAFSPAPTDPAAPAPQQVVNSASRRNCRRAWKKLVSSSEKLIASTTTALQSHLKEERRIRLDRLAIHHHALEVCCLTVAEVLNKLKSKELTYLHLRDNAENLCSFAEYHAKTQQPNISKFILKHVRNLLVMTGEVALRLEHYSGLQATRWSAVAKDLPAGEDIPVPNLEPMIPSLKLFTNPSVLGGGGFGCVYKVLFAGSVVCAIKFVKEEIFEGMAQHACVDKVVFGLLRNPFHLSFHCSFQCCQYFVSVMEYVCGVDMSKVIKTSKGFPEDICKFAFAQLGLSVQYLHMKGLIHRDIKPSNILLLSGTKLKLIDFDTAKIGLGKYSRRLLQTFNLRSYCEFNDKESAGTQSFFSPEVIRCRPYGRAIDWWSVGVSCFQSFFAKLPFGGRDRERLRNIATCNYNFDFPPKATPSESMKSFISALIHKPASDRLCSASIYDLQKHSWFSDINWESLAAGKLERSFDYLDNHLSALKKDDQTNPNVSKQFKNAIDWDAITDSPQQLALYVYASKAFVAALQKANNELAITPDDLKLPDEAICLRDQSLPYRFESYLFTPVARGRTRGRAGTDTSDSK